MVRPDIVQPCGDCYRWALEYVRQHPGSVLVHGVVTVPYKKPIHKYKHAWVEDRGVVMDWQTMEAWHGGIYRGKGYPVDVFIELYKPEKVSRYTTEAALSNALRTGHFGPWKKSELGSRQRGRKK